MSSRMSSSTPEHNEGNFHVAPPIFPVYPPRRSPYLHPRDTPPAAPKRPHRALSLARRARPAVAEGLPHRIRTARSAAAMASRLYAGASAPWKISACRNSTQNVETESSSRRRSRSHVGEHAGGLLPQAQQLGAQIVLHLGAIKTSVHHQRRRPRLCRKAVVLALNVVELDGETIGGSRHFPLGEQQRRRVAVFAPPAENGLARGEFARPDDAQHAQHVVIGEIRDGGRRPQPSRRAPRRPGARR